MSGRRYTFGPWTVDCARGALVGENGDIPLRPKSFDVLCHLLAHAGRLVSRDELMDAVWSSVTVTEESLTQCVSDIRRALGDVEQRILKTVPKRGYLFAAPVYDASLADANPQGSERDVAPPPLGTLDRSSIAVLPFANLSGDDSQSYLSDGITEDIITELSRFSDLLVIGRNSSFRYKGANIDARHVGRELGARYILQGSFRRNGDRARISVQLLDAVTGAHRWAERYDREVEDIFAVQDEIARTVAPILAAHVNKAEIERTLNKPPAAWQAYDYYLRAACCQASYYSTFSAPNLYEVRRLLEQSLALDPNYARAYVRLSWTYFTAWINPLDDDHLNAAALDRAYQLAGKAVQLDPQLPDGHAMLGHVLGRRREHEAALAGFERALALNPNFTDWRFAENLVWAGEPERAMAALERLMRIDPFYVPNAPMCLGMAHYMLKAYAQALKPLQECVSRAPNLRSGHVWLAATYAQLGRLEEARTEAVEVLRLQPSWTNEGTGKQIYVFRHAEDAAHLFDALRKAGLPD